MIFIKWNKDGTHRPYWYMRYRVSSGTPFKEKQLPVKIKGTPPASKSIKDLGDVAYEKSKALAEAKAAEFMEDRKEKGTSLKLNKALYQEKTGEAPSYPRLDELPSLWASIARERTPNEKRMKCNATVFKRFADFCAVDGIKYLHEVKAHHVAEYFNIIKEHLAWSTVQDQMTLLAGAFKRFMPTGCGNPFGMLIKRSYKKESRKIHKSALKNDQLPVIYETAKTADEDFIYQIAVCAACTGMRIGDVCNLKWEQISHDNHIQVTTSKAGVYVSIPIFPELQKVLDGLLVTKDPNEEYVFPDAANLYKHNPSGLYQRGKKLFANALFPTLPPSEDVTEVINGEPVPPKTLEEILTAIDTAGFAPKKSARLKDVISRRMAGESYTTISKAIGKARAQISQDLEAIGNLVGEAYRPGARHNSLAKRKALTRTKRENGKNAVSRYGWHSFRATFATIAHGCGVSDDTIIQIIGHTTFKTTENYIDYKALAADKELEKMSGTALAKGYKANAIAFTDEDLQLLALIKSLPPEQKALALAKAKQP